MKKTTKKKVIICSSLFLLLLALLTGLFFWRKKQNYLSGLGAATKLFYFKNCKTIDEVKKTYKDLAMEHHPDRGGDTATMQQINAEYKSIIKNPNFDFKDQTQEDQDEFLKYPEILNQILGLQGIIIEIIGDWIWVSGNTYAHKDLLKSLGFYFAPKKTMWYYRPANYKSYNKTPQSIEKIRSKYGSKIVSNHYRNMELAS